MIQPETSMNTHTHSSVESGSPTRHRSNSVRSGTGKPKIKALSNKKLKMKDRTKNNKSSVGHAYNDNESDFADEDQLPMFKPAQ